MTGVGGDATARRQQRRGFRTSTLLIVVAVVPLLGALLVGWQSVRRTSEQSTATDAAELASQRAVDLARLESALFDEMVWRSVDVTTQSVGLEPDALDGILDAEAAGLLAEAERRLDEALAQVAPGDLDGEPGEELQAVRADAPDLDAVLTGYRGLLEGVGERFDGVLESLAGSAVDSAGGAVAESVAVLGMAVELRQVLVDQFYGYYASVLEVRDPVEEELIGLIGLRTRYREVTESLRSSAATPAGLLESLSSMEADPEFTTFGEGIETVISAALADGAGARRNGPLSYEAAVADFQFFTPMLRTIERSSGTTAAMLDEATGAVGDAIDDVRRNDANEIRGTYAWLALLVAISVVVVALAARLLLRPLRSLQSRAQQLRENPGGETDPVVGGPAEVRSAAEAISEAAQHIRHAALQADALAAGNLDSDVFEGEVSGGLGAALQDSVATLRESLAQQEEFRHRLAHDAIHDGLTHIPNRTSTLAILDAALQRSAGGGGDLAVLFVDLDDFKDINDLHGHHTGDAVLVEVAQRLGDHLRGDDVVGRLGGDEFLVIAEPVGEEAEAVDLARRLLEELARPIVTEAVTCTAGASIGIAMACDGDGTADQLVRDADLALYRAKELGRGGVHVCDDSLRSSAEETSTIAEGIRAAIRNDELLLHYQPIVSARSRQICAVEALVRWQRPGEEGLSPPSNFIGVAERSSLIIDIDLWVLDTVAAQLAQWAHEGLPEVFAVAVNVSARHLASRRFVADILAALERHGVDPTRLVVEITEGALVDDLTEAAQKLEALRDAGVRVSIDDFGTGYTSLAHLRSLPFDVLKIDRTFAGYTVERRYEAVVSKLIIDAGHLLGAAVVAEGIETPADADTLTRMGADELQGFHLYRPKPAEQVWESVVSGASVSR